MSYKFIYQGALSSARLSCKLKYMQKLLLNSNDTTMQHLFWVAVSLINLSIGFSDYDWFSSIAIFFYSLNNSKQFVISKKLIFFESWKSQTPYPPLQFHSHAFEDLSSYLSEILLSLGTCFQGFHQHYSKMYPLESTEVRFQNYVTVFSRVLHVIYKWDVLLNYLLLFLYVNEWHFCSSLLIPYYLVTIKIVIYIYVKTFQKHIPDDITLEYTVYVALLEKKFTLHLLSLFTTPLLGMTKKIALA